MVIQKRITCYDLKRNFFLHFPGIVAIGYINEAIDEGDPFKTLETLMLPTAKIRDVDPGHALHYQDVLYRAKSQKLRVGFSSLFKFAGWGGERDKKEEF